MLFMGENWPKSVSVEISDWPEFWLFIFSRPGALFRLCLPTSRIPCSISAHVKVFAGNASPRLEPELREVVEAVVAEEDKAAGLQVLADVSSHRLHVIRLHGRLKQVKINIQGGLTGKLIM